jgi:hypothetical protein
MLHNVPFLPVIFPYLSYFPLILENINPVGWFYYQVRKNMKKLLSVVIAGLMLISTSSFADARYGYYVGCAGNYGIMWIIRAANTQQVSELFETCESQGGTPYLIDGRK